MKKIFDLNRFVQTVRWETMTEQRDYIRCAVSLGIVMTILFCWPVITMNSGNAVDGTLTLSDITYTFHMHSLAGMAMVTCMISLTFGASRVFRNLQTKQQRINFFMLPATNLEKYLVRYLHVSVGYFVCFCAALVFADIMHFLFLGVMTDGMNGSVIVEMLKGLDEMRKGFKITPGFTITILETFALFITMHFVNNAFWIFCGTLFRRNAWFFTLCLQFMLLFVMIFVNFNVFDFIDLLDNLFEGGYAELTFWTGIVMAWVFTATLYYASYRLMCRMQVINNKWVNL